MDKSYGHINSEYDFLNVPKEEFLCQDDIDYYKKLKETLTSHICRNCRNKRVESFSKILLLIQYFVYRKKEDSWKRSLLCGVCWYKNYICVNIKQMSYLLEKCKSSINGSLQRLYFFVLTNKKESVKILIEAIPYLQNHSELLQKWSVRQACQIYKNQVQSVQINPHPEINLNQYSINKQIIVPKRKPRKSQRPIVENQTNNDDTNLEFKSNFIKKEKNDDTQNSSLFDLFDDSKLAEDYFDKYYLF